MADEKDPPVKSTPKEAADPMALLEQSADESSPLSGVIDLPPPGSVPVPLPMPAPTVWAAAVVDDITPTSGPIVGGTRVTLTGKHLYRVSIVRFGEALAQTVGAREPHEIRVLVPARVATGAVDVTVLNPGAVLALLEAGYTYVALAAPKIESVAPRHADAKGGSSLTLIGKNFLSDTKVLIGGAAPTKVTFVDAGTLEVVVPGGKSGTMMDVAVENADGKRDVLRRAFKYG